MHGIHQRSTPQRASSRAGAAPLMAVAVIGSVVILVGGSGAAASAPSAVVTGSSAPGVTTSVPPAPSGSVQSTPPADLVTIPMTSPRDVLFAFGSVWVAGGPAKTVTRLDPATNAVQAIVTVPDPASVLASSDDAIWLTSYPGNSLTRIDPVADRATGTVSLAPAGQGPIGVTVYDGFVWVANHDGSPTTSVAKIDPATLKVMDVIPAGTGDSAGPTWISSGAGSLWVDVPNSDAVMRIDPATDTVTATIADTGVCTSLAATDAAVWVASSEGDGCTGGVIEIDPSMNQVVAHLNSGDGTGPLALSDGSVWFGTDPSGYLGLIDRRLGHRDPAGQAAGPGVRVGGRRRLRVGHRPSGQRPVQAPDALNATDPRDSTGPLRWTTGSSRMRAMGLSSR